MTKIVPGDFLLIPRYDDKKPTVYGIACVLQILEKGDKGTVRLGLYNKIVSNESGIIEPLLEDFSKIIFTESRVMNSKKFGWVRLKESSLTLKNSYNEYLQAGSLYVNCVPVRERTKEDESLYPDLVISNISMAQLKLRHVVKYLGDRETFEIFLQLDEEMSQQEIDNQRFDIEDFLEEEEVGEVDLNDHDMKAHTVTIRLIADIDDSNLEKIQEALDEFDADGTITKIPNPF